LTALVDS